MAQEWAQKLQTDKVKEFSFFPNAYTPFEEGGFALPEMEMEWDGGDDSQDKSDAQQSQVPQWVKNLSFTVGGVTIGAASVFALMSGPPPAAPPAPVCPQQTVCAPAPAPAGGPRTVPAAPAPAAPTTPAASTTGATSTPAATSSGGTV